MKVDKQQFTTIVNNLLKADPVKRSDAKTGKPKTGKIIPAVKTS